MAHGPLTPYRRDAFWGGTEAGYNDFAPYREAPPAEAGIVQFDTKAGP